MRVGDAEDEHGEDGEHVLSAELLAGGEDRTIIEYESWAVVRQLCRCVRL